MTETLAPTAKGDLTFITLGCRLNGYESEVMRAHATAAGLDDTIVVNTCAVTAEAVRQATQTIRRLRRERPTARIVVTGCAAQIAPERFADLEEVDHIIGNTEKMRAETFASLAKSSRVQVNDIMSLREIAPQSLTGFANRARATVEVQNGCDHRCTFCVIPFGRGPSRSVPMADVVARIRAVVEQGYAEVVLTGVDLTSYGNDLRDQPSLGQLVQRVLADVGDLARLRLSSIDQIEADSHLIRAIADEPRLMPHLHLSLQSGDDLILKRMKRRHTRKDSIRFCDEARRLRPDIIFGADLIAGFPTESDAMFRKSLELIDECGLTFLHVFPFSPRSGTPAARMPQLSKPEIKARAKQLREHGQLARYAFMRSQVGTTADVLVERGGVGHTPQFADVIFSKASAPVGSIVPTRLAGLTADYKLTGEVL